MRKRNINWRLLIPVVLLVCALIVAGFFLVRLMGSFSSGDGQTPAVQPEDGTSAVTPQPDGAGGTASQPAAVPDYPAHAEGALTMYYDDAAVTRSQAESGVVSLVTEATASLPRLDLQCLDGDLTELSADELQQVAVGLVQAYYVDAPATDSLTVSVDQTLRSAFVIDAPETADAPALTAQVRFLQASDGLWYLVLLTRADAEAPPALLVAYQSVTVQ